jgi:hypothetical protein
MAMMMASHNEGRNPFVLKPLLMWSVISITMALAMVLVIIPSPTKYKIPRVRTFRIKVMSQPIKKLTTPIVIATMMAVLKFRIKTVGMAIAARYNTEASTSKWIKSLIILFRN